MQIKVARHYPFPSQKVYDAFLDPKKASKFLFATQNGKMIRADIEPRVKGKFNFTDSRPEGEISHIGTYLELERPKRIVFEFLVEKNGTKFSESKTKVSIDIIPREDFEATECEVALTQEMDPAFEAYKDRVIEGWNSILEGLANELSEKSRDH